MKKLVIAIFAIAAILMFVQPVAADTPPDSYAPPVTITSSTPMSFNLPEVGIQSIDIVPANGTSVSYTLHIVHPPSTSNASEESWIEFTGDVTGSITFLSPDVPTLYFSTQGEETTVEVTVHIQQGQPMITLQSSEPILIEGAGSFTTALVRILPSSPYIQIIHPKSLIP